MCAGVGMLSRVVKLHGFNVPALDITYWETYTHRRPTNSNPLDLLGDAGFASLSLCCVQELQSSRFSFERGSPINVCACSEASASSSAQGTKGLMLPFWAGVLFMGCYLRLFFGTALPLSSWRPDFAMGGGCQLHGQQALWYRDLNHKPPD